MQFVQLLSLLLCMLSVFSLAASQECPSTGLACYPGDCCAFFRQCSGSTWWPVQPTAPGTVCKANGIVLAADCTAQCNAPAPAPSTQAPATQAPATEAPATQAPVTVAPATQAPATQAPATQAPATQAPATQAPATQAPATQAPATQAPATQAPATQAPATQKPTQAPVVAATTKPISGGSSKFGQLLMAYYSGIGLETIGTGGLNAIALAFFDPSPLAVNQNCDFSGSTSACIVPASGSGEGKTLGWAMDKIVTATPLLSPNTAPVRNGKPTIFISFGGYSQGGAVWDDIFGSAAKATLFGRNAAKLVNTVYQRNNQAAYIGFDLDIEETITALPHMAEFIAAFRADAAYDLFPLQLCTLSGLSDPSNPDHFKIGIMQQFGPAQGGINYLNMMVANLDLSCDGMSAYWLHPALNFLPAANKVLGMWGELLPSWILHNPGCSSGNNLFGQIRSSQMGIGIWQWWVGASTEVTAVLNAVRSG